MAITTGEIGDRVTCVALARYSCGAGRGAHAGVPTGEPFWVPA
jgi:hypothetical protein